MGLCNGFLHSNGCVFLGRARGLQGSGLVVESSLSSNPLGLVQALFFGVFDDRGECLGSRASYLLFEFSDCIAEMLRAMESSLADHVSDLQMRGG